MANENELQLGMSVDTAEALANVKQFGAEFKKSATDMKESLGEASKTDVFSEIKLQALQLQEEIKNLERSSTKLIQVLGETAFTSPESKQALLENIQQIEKKRAALDLLSKEMDVSGKKINTNVFHTGAFRTALSQATYTLYQINPAAGMFVSHLTPMISGLQRVNLVGGGFKAALTAIGSQLIGPLGIVTSLAIFTSALGASLKPQKDAIELTQEYTTALSELRSELERASYQTLRNKEILLTIELLRKQAEAEKEIEAQRLSRAEKNALTPGLAPTTPATANQETKDSIKLLEDQLKLIRQYKNELGVPNQIRNRIAELELKLGGLRDQKDIDKVNLEIKKQRELLDVILGKTKAVKDYSDKVLITDEQLLKNLASIDTQLKKTNLSERERNILLADRLKIVNELNSIEQERIGQIIQRDIDASIADDDILFGDLSGDALAQTSGRSGRFGDNKARGINEELEIQLSLTSALKEGFENAGAAVSGAMANSIVMFKRASSVLQIFINELIRAASQALILKAIMFIGNIVSAGASGGTSAVSSSPASGDGGAGLFTKPSIAPTPGTGFGSQPQVIMQTIVMETRVSGRDLALIQKKTDNLNKKF